MIWNPFTKTCKIDFGNLKIHVYKCKLSKTFKDIYPYGLCIYNIVLSQKITYKIISNLVDVPGIGQVIPGGGGYNIIIEIPSTYPHKQVIAMAALAVYNAILDKEPLKSEVEDEEDTASGNKNEKEAVH